MVLKIEEKFLGFLFSFKIIIAEMSNKGEKTTQKM